MTEAPTLLGLGRRAWIGVVSYLPVGHVRFDYGHGVWDEFWCTVGGEPEGRWSARTRARSFSNYPIRSRMFHAIRRSTPAVKGCGRPAPVISLEKRHGRVLFHAFLRRLHHRHLFAGQFERPSYEPSQELTRLIQVLQPSDLRHNRVYYPAYVFYAGLLVGIYALLCIFGSVPLLKAMGFAIENASELEQSAIAPLIISFTMVGLAPTVPALQRFEEKIPFAAHRLSGIPARLLYGCRILNARVLDIPEPGRGHLIPERDWERLRLYRRHAATALNNPDDFARDLPKIIAYRSWFMEQNLVAPAGTRRSGILRSEPDLRARIESLMLGLDTLVALPLDEQSRDVWEKYAKEADELARDVCAMIMLYVEHDLVRFLGAGTQESADARRTLEDSIGTARVWAEESAVVGPLLVRAAIVTVVTSCIFGIASANIHEVGMMPIEAGPTFALTAFSAYSLSLLIALHLHDHAFRSGSWANMATNDWARWMGPASGIFVIAGAVSLVCMVALNLYWAMVAYGPEAVFSKFWGAAVQAALIEAPRALLGPILVGVIAIVDHARADGRQSSWLSVIAVTVAALVLWAMLSRGLVAQYGLAQACNAAPECPGDIPTLLTMLWSEDKMLMAGLQAGAIGTIVLFVCRRTLIAGTSGSPHGIVPAIPPSAARIRCGRPGDKAAGDH